MSSRWLWYKKVLFFCFTKMEVCCTLSPAGNGTFFIAFFWPSIEVLALKLVSWDREVLPVLSSTVKTKLWRRSAAIHEISSCLPQRAVVSDPWKNISGDASNWHSPFALRKSSLWCMPTGINEGGKCWSLPLTCFFLLSPKQKRDQMISSRSRSLQRLPPVDHSLITAWINHPPPLLHIRSSGPYLNQRNMHEKSNNIKKK